MSNIITGTVVAGSSLYRTLALTHIEDSWAFSLMKEVWQNTIDLPSVSKLDITIDQEDTDYTSITFVDNGPGMSLSTLTEVYLVYGETTKANDDSKIGGYGLGRVTCTFGAHSYSIRSQDWRCEGEGEKYTLRNNLPYFKGFKLIVRFPSITRSGSKVSAIQAVRDYLKGCYSERITVTLNGETWDQWLDKGKSIGSLAFCTAYESSIYDCYVVAENGNGDALFLLRKYIYGKFKSGAVIVVPPGLTKKVMNTARTQFESVYNSQLNDFIASELELHEPRVEVIFQDKGEYKSFHSEYKVLDILNSLDFSSIKELLSQVHSIASFEDKGVEGRAEELSMAWEGTEEELEGFKELLEDNKEYVTLFSEVTSLLVEWGIQVLNTSNLSHYNDGWKAGLYLGKPELRGLCKDVNYNVTIYVNIFSHTQDYKNIDISKMIATVLHEVAHIVEGSHDSDYATVLTKFIEAAVPSIPSLTKMLEQLNLSTSVELPEPTAELDKVFEVCV